MYSFKTNKVKHFLFLHINLLISYAIQSMTGLFI